MGPLFWNLIFDEAIEITGRSGNGSIGFADDLIVVVSADSRSGIETKANEVTRDQSGVRGRSYSYPKGRRK